MEYRKVFFMYRKPEYCIDGMRSALGMAVENMYSFGAVIDVETEEMDENQKESLEMLRDMEGDIYSTEKSNVDKYGLEPITIEELGEKLRDMDRIIPYGIK